MSAAPSPAPRRALKQTTSGGFIAWARRTFGRATPRAQVIAAPALRLGDELDVSWRIDYGHLEVTNVSVTLLGTEVARQRISARTGISIITETRPFLELAIDRKMPEQTARSAAGRGAVSVPLSTVPSVAGTLNEIVWAIVVEAAYQAKPIWRGDFPVAVLPRSR
ncbi:MAG TPA: hypothetical protein VLA79_13865 [Polyangia bacterium]|nr:hypothetical protein [Polyangia bacterium]